MSPRRATSIVFVWAVLATRCVGADGASPARPSGGARALWACIAAPSLEAAIRPLAERRSSQGLETAVLAPPVEKALESLPRPPAHVLLVGDDLPGASGEPWYLPARRVDGHYWRGDGSRTFASDSIFGDLDRDDVPDVPVGRIPARSPAEVSVVVRKIIAFEERAPTLDDLRIPFWAGDPMYGPVIQAMAPMVALDVVRKHTPGWMQPWILAADPGHPLCGWPPDQPELFTRQIRRGALLGVLMSHGSITSMHGITHEGRSIDYTVRLVADAFAEGPPAPPVIVFTCSSGDFSARTTCLTEAMVLAPGGPVAAIGATEESHPLPNYYSGVCLAKTLVGRPRTIGDLWLRTQRSGLKERNVLMEGALKRVESSQGMATSVALLKRDQPLIYALLGDPATRIRSPEPLEVSLEREGDGWRYRVTPPAGARELHVERRAEAEMPPRAPLPAAAEARRRLNEANATLEYRSVSPAGAAPAWEGALSEAGSYRFVALTGRAIHVATRDARR
jgi:hypothetical protein